MVNHSKLEFKSPDGATTNAIEGVWSGIKRLIRLSDIRKVDPQVLLALTAEYAWRVEARKDQANQRQGLGVQRLAGAIRDYIAA